MRVELVMPSSDQTKLQNSLLRMLTLAKELNVALDGENFARAWMSDNTRVVVVSDNGKDIGLGIMVFGRRYYDADHSASVLIAEGEGRNQVLEYFLEMCKVLGARVMYYEGRVGDTIEGETTPQRYIEVQA